MSLTAQTKQLCKQILLITSKNPATTFNIYSQWATSVQRPNFLLLTPSALLESVPQRKTLHACRFVGHHRSVVPRLVFLRRKARHRVPRAAAVQQTGGGVPLVVHLRRLVLLRIAAPRRTVNAGVPLVVHLARLVLLEVPLSADVAARRRVGRDGQQKCRK